ncbi:ChaC-like protein [Rhodobacteraceae bacterium THAF1]|uniref:gamma-glutamylcyclotransferase n=1 Tax=Palleronia sp. THAF1 TaxID=2587842 RepID=UPI000F3B23A8|nr:gamma-glutamylcyclotransferase [Palleronia sp. THAF1]QFU07789.1 ChaC-like protein [Palleronia sp. THAF1]VDC25604.1 ChaC-like protein [Rhodobacteraceae bacterium THAF1]
MNVPVQPEKMWVFGYGSLVWNPEFPVAEQVVARLDGYARSFCMSSIHHRGTPEAPGLVLALDERPGQVCTGVALRVRDGHEDATLAMLRERELVSSAYVERNLSVDLEDGRQVTAVSYVIDQNHEQYLRDLDLETQAKIIAGAVGGRGPNDEYLFNTTSHLAQLGIADADLDWLSARVRDLKAT